MKETKMQEDALPCSDSYNGITEVISDLVEAATECHSNDKDSMEETNKPEATSDDSSFVLKSKIRRTYKRRHGEPKTEQKSMEEPVKEKKLRYKSNGKTYT